MKKINHYAGMGIADREYLTDVGFAIYVLFVEGKPCGVFEAKRKEQGHKSNEREDHLDGYASSKLKHLNNEPLSFVYISTREGAKFIY